MGVDQLFRAGYAHLILEVIPMVYLYLESQEHMNMSWTMEKKVEKNEKNREDWVVLLVGGKGDGQWTQLLLPLVVTIALYRASSVLINIFLSNGPAKSLLEEL